MNAKENDATLKLAQLGLAGTSIRLSIGSPACTDSGITHIPAHVLQSRSEAQPV